MAVSSVYERDNRNRYCVVEFNPEINNFFLLTYARSPAAAWAFVHARLPRGASGAVRIYDPPPADEVPDEGGRRHTRRVRIADANVVSYSFFDGEFGELFAEG